MQRSSTLTALAEAIADGRRPDWSGAASNAGDAREHALIAQLQAASVVASRRAAVYGTTVPPEGFGSDIELAPGTTWGSLRILGRVGHGRYGDVYRAYDPSLDREVALKLLRARDPDPIDASAVIEEGRLMARVRHPNVMTIHGAQAVEGRTGLWMEFVEGRTLAAEVKQRGSLPAGEIAAIASSLCDALVAVHDAGLVHRDVKAQNVLRDAGGRVVLGDFGTGRELQSREATTGLAGTPAYLAPEIYAGEHASPQSDLYSLGVLLYHLATGDYPVNGDSLESIREAHTDRRRSTMASMRSAVPGPLVRIIDRALEPDRRHRYADAREMGLDLQRLHHPSRARRLAAATVLVTLLAGVGWWATRSRPSEAALPFESRDWVLVTAFDNQTGDPRLTSTIEPALERALASSQFLNVIPQLRVDDTLTLMRRTGGGRPDMAMGREVALRDGGIHVLVAGHVHRQRERFVITADLVRPADGVVATSLRQEAATADEVVPAIDRLALLIREAVGETGLGDRRAQAALPRVTTVSLEALQLYGNALEIWRSKPWREAAPIAEPLLRHALARDPSFSAAHILLAKVLRTLSRNKEAVEHLEQARATVEKNVDVEELWVTGQADQLQAQLTTDVASQRALFERSVATLEALRQLQPDRYDVVSELQYVHRRLGHLEQSRDLAFRQADLRPTHPESQVRAGQMAMESGSPTLARDYVNKARELGASPANVTGLTAAWLELFEAHEAWFRNAPGEALAVVDEAFGKVQALPPGGVRTEMALAVGEMYVTLGRLDTAEQVAVYRTPEGEQVWAAAGAVAQRQDPARMARFLREQVKEQEIRVRLNSHYIDAGMLVAARQNIVEFRRLLPHVSVSSYEGQLALAEGRIDDAVRHLTSALATETGIGSPGAAGRLPRKLAAALRAAGRTEAAVDVLETASRARGLSVAGLSAGYEWLRVRDELALLYRHLGRIAEAEQIERQLQVLLAVADDDHPIKRRVLGSVGPSAPR